MSKQKINILIFSEAEATILGILRSLAKCDYTINLLVDRCPDYILSSRYLSKFMKFDAKKGEEHIYHILKEAIAKFQPDVLLTADVLSSKIVSRHFEELSKLTRVCLVPPEEFICLTDNKWEMAKFCMQEDIAHPYSICLNESNLEDIKKLNFPIVAKLAYSVGGIGTILIENESEVEEKLKEISDSSKLYLCQEYKEGTDFILNFYAVDGEIKYYVIQKGLIKYDYFSAAHEWAFEENEKLLEISSKIAKAMNWSGVGNLDFRYEESTNIYYVLELNPRFWHSLVAATTMGVNFPYWCIQHALGRDLEDIQQKIGRFYMRKPRIGRIIKEGYKLRETALHYELRDPFPLMTKKLKFLKFLIKKKRLFPSSKEVITKEKELIIH